MKYYMQMTRKVFPKLRWLNVFVPATLKDWLATGEKSISVEAEAFLFQENQRHPAESRMVRSVEPTPKP